MPVVVQPADYHRFADDRAFLGIANAADVLSNLGFVAVGLLGLYRLQQGSRPLSPAVRLGLHVFFVGFFLTGFGSAYYHWHPTDETLPSSTTPSLPGQGLRGPLEASIAAMSPVAISSTSYRLLLANNSIGTIRAPAKPRATLAMACVAMSP